MPGDIILTHVYQKQWSHDVQFLKYGVRQTDRRTTNRQMDRWMDGKGENQVVCPSQKETNGQKENIKHYLQVQSINFGMVCRPLSSWQLNFTKYLPEKSLDNIKW